MDLNRVDRGSMSVNWIFHFLKAFSSLIAVLLFVAGLQVGVSATFSLDENSSPNDVLDVHLYSRHWQAEIYLAGWIGWPHSRVQYHFWSDAFHRSGSPPQHWSKALRRGVDRVTTPRQLLNTLKRPSKKDTQIAGVVCLWMDALKVNCSSHGVFYRALVIPHLPVTLSNFQIALPISLPNRM